MTIAPTYLRKRKKRATTRVYLPPSLSLLITGCNGLFFIVTSHGGATREDDCNAISKKEEGERERGGREGKREEEVAAENERFEGETDRRIKMSARVAVSLSAYRAYMIMQPARTPPLLPARQCDRAHPRRMSPPSCVAPTLSPDAYERAEGRFTVEVSTRRENPWTAARTSRRNVRREKRHVLPARKKYLINYLVATFSLSLSLLVFFLFLSILYRRAAADREISAQQ